ncbi:MAG: hypothetical protein VX071_06505, partial [Candidatus Thermoplasmatota archaeon]|nr:hypothetical protein [Candidatus Thermoplasmatota archaeon]
MRYHGDNLNPTAEKKLEIYFKHLDEQQPEASSETPFSQTNLEGASATIAVREVSLLSAKEMDQFKGQLDEEKRSALELVEETMK